MASLWLQQEALSLLFPAQDIGSFPSVAAMS
jgi:hypothetical protein